MKHSLWFKFKRCRVLSGNYRHHHHHSSGNGFMFCWYLRKDCKWRDGKCWMNERKWTKRKRLKTFYISSIYIGIRIQKWKIQYTKTLTNRQMSKHSSKWCSQLKIKLFQHHHHQHSKETELKEDIWTNISIFRRNEMNQFCLLASCTKTFQIFKILLHSAACFWLNKENAL